MAHTRSYRVAVIPGDGIGVEVIASAINLLDAVHEWFGGDQGTVEVTRPLVSIVGEPDLLAGRA